LPHFDKGGGRVAHRRERVQNDHRHGHDADGKNFGREPDAIGESDDRDQSRKRRRLRDNEEWRSQPFRKPVQSHQNPKADAEDDRKNEADGQGFQRDQQGTRQ
jgi:hypothetical protein